MGFNSGFKGLNVFSVQVVSQTCCIGTGALHDSSWRSLPSVRENKVTNQHEPTDIWVAHCNDR